MLHIYTHFKILFKDFFFSIFQNRNNKIYCLSIFKVIYHLIHKIFDTTKLL